MKVCDYVSDMILNTTFVIDVQEVSGYPDFDFKNVAYPFKIPFGYCKYLNYPVRYINVVDGYLTLYVTDYIEN